MNSFTRRGFIKLSAGGMIASTLGYELGRGAEADVDADISKRLASFGGKFRFAIFADPHMAHPDNHDPVPTNAFNNLQKAVSEVNAMDPEVAFVVHIGDLGNVADKQSLDHWLEAVQPLKPLSLLVHGNHDGFPPYEIFKSYEDKINHLTSVFYSFDCGGWHFVAIPCNINANNPQTKSLIKDLLAFLEKDLDENSDKPTIVLHHFHFMPIGLTQTEWYFYTLELRKQLLALYTKHGNVKWAFNGHVHNGIKPSIKTSWNHRGINYINCPTIIEGRPFGEEEPGYEAGKTGGYYVTVEVDGKNVKLQGHLAGVSQPFDYPDQFQPFTDEVEPKFFHLIGELPASPELVNGTFADQLKGWSLPYRYMRETDPVYSAEVVKKDETSAENALHITTREAGVPFWARDEYYEAAQTCALQSGKTPLISASYNVPEEPKSGGGYVRLELLRDLEFSFLMMLHWGVNEDQSVYYPVGVGYALDGREPIWRYFPQLANQKKGFFWQIPMTTEKWHDLVIDVAGLYNKAKGQPGAFSEANPNKIRLAVGTWNDRVIGTSSQAKFGGIKLSHIDSPQASTIDGQELAQANAVPIQFGMSMGTDTKEGKAKKGY